MSADIRIVRVRLSRDDYARADQLSDGIGVDQWVSNIVSDILRAHAMERARRLPGKVECAHARLEPDRKISPAADGSRIYVCLDCGARIVRREKGPK